MLGFFVSFVFKPCPGGGVGGGGGGWGGGTSILKVTGDVPLDRV